MTKEEIEKFLKQDKYNHLGYYDTEHEFVVYPEDDTIRLLKEYSDIQNKELTERVKELESKLTELRIKHNFLCKQYNKLC